MVQSLASSRSNGEPACCAFRDAHDETLKAMGEPEYWWTMDSLVEAAAEKEAQSAVAHASHVVQPPSHQESMQTRTMKRLAGGIRRLNKLSDRPCACVLVRRKTALSQRACLTLRPGSAAWCSTTRSHSIAASRTKTARSGWPSSWRIYQRDIGDVLKHGEETLRPAPDAASRPQAS